MQPNRIRIWGHLYSILQCRHNVKYGILGSPDCVCSFYGGFVTGHGAFQGNRKQNIARSAAARTVSPFFAYYVVVTMNVDRLCKFLVSEIVKEERTASLRRVCVLLNQIEPDKLASPTAGAFACQLPITWTPWSRLLLSF